MLTPREQQDLDRLRGFRARPDRAVRLDRAFAAYEEHFKRLRRRLGGVEGVWEESAPADLIDRTELVSIRIGLLTVRVSDASARFELARWLRGGGEAELARRSDGAIKRVRLVL